MSFLFLDHELNSCKWRCWEYAIMVKETTILLLLMESAQDRSIGSRMYYLSVLSYREVHPVENLLSPSTPAFSPYHFHTLPLTTCSVSPLFELRQRSLRLFCLLQRLYNFDSSDDCRMPAHGSAQEKIGSF